VRHLTAPGLDAPAGVAVDPRGVAYVANFYGHNIVLVAPDGRLFGKWGQPGPVGLGALHYPTDVAVAPDGLLWVADAYNNRLRRFVNGRADLLVAGFEVAVGVAVDRVGRV
jgi:DNA-binding beta-propeller fold protein YncE